MLPHLRGHGAGAPSLARPLYCRSDEPRTLARTGVGMGGEESSTRGPCGRITATEQVQVLAPSISGFTHAARAAVRQRFGAHAPDPSLPRVHRRHQPTRHRPRLRLAWCQCQSADQRVILERRIPGGRAASRGPGRAHPWSLPAAAHALARHRRRRQGRLVTESPPSLHHSRRPACSPLQASRQPP